MSRKNDKDALKRRFLSSSDMSTNGASSTYRCFNLKVKDNGREATSRFHLWNLFLCFHSIPLTITNVALMHYIHISYQSNSTSNLYSYDLER